MISFQIPSLIACKILPLQSGWFSLTKKYLTDFLDANLFSVGKYSVKTKHLTSMKMLTDLTDPIDLTIYEQLGSDVLTEWALHLFYVTDCDIKLPTSNFDVIYSVAVAPCRYNRFHGITSASQGKCHKSVHCILLVCRGIFAISYLYSVW